MKKRVNIKYGPVSSRVATQFIKELPDSTHIRITKRPEFLPIHFDLTVQYSDGIYIFTTVNSRVEEYNKRNSGGLKSWHDGDESYEDYITHLRCEDTRNAMLTTDDLYHMLVTGRYAVA